jgi:hypothetical protein
MAMWDGIDADETFRLELLAAYVDFCVAAKLLLARYRLEQAFSSLQPRVPAGCQPAGSGREVAAGPPSSL